MGKQVHRFNPTVNGDLSAGHILPIKVSERMAHASGGRFIVRIDDTQQYWNERQTKKKTEHLISMYKSELEWLEIQVDLWECQSEMLERTNVKGIPLHQVIDEWAEILHTQKVRYCHDWCPTVLSRPGQPQYPFTDYFTLEKVWLDFEEGVNTLVRGEDLIDEFALYCHYVEAIGLPRVEFVYVPRVDMVGFNVFDPTVASSISKSNGNLQLGSLIGQLVRKGYSNRDFWVEMQAACLKDPIDCWTLDNIKVAPAVQGMLVELDQQPFPDKVKNG